jgi:type I restriction enzyme S subunit
MLYKAKGYIGGKGIGIKGLSASALKNYCIPLPPLAEQHRIVQKIEELYAEIDNMTVENNININEIEVTDNE